MNNEPNPGTDMHSRISVHIAIALLLIGGLRLPASGMGAAGNLKGKVTDVSTGEALPLVNILIVGSGRGQVTDNKGEYFIKDITPGTYILRVSLLGYQTIEAKNVAIEGDETAVYNFKLASTDIELEGVTVVGHPPLVDVTKTAGDQTYNREKIEQLPNLTGVEDVLGLQAGVVKFGNRTFLRGGRANETVVLVDGVPVNDVTGRVGPAGTSTVNENLGQLYSGNTTAGVSGALSVPVNAIASVSVQSSGLDAEYGNAQSGVVNITTRTGGDHYSGSVQYRTDGVTDASYDENFYAADLGGPEPITTYLLPSLGLDIPGNMSFFMSGTFNQSDGPYSYNTGGFYQPLERKIQFGGFLGGLFNGLGFTYTDKQNNAYSFNSKISYDPSESDQFSYSYRANTETSHPLQGFYQWKDRYDSTTSAMEVKNQNVLQWTHIFGTNSLLKANVNRQETDRTESVGDLIPAQYSTITDPSIRDPNFDGFVDLSTAQGWSTSNTDIWNFKLDFGSQVHPLHFLKMGGEYYYEQIQSTSISRPNDPNRPPDTTGFGAYPGYGFVRWVSNNIPSHGALYAQDNIELTGINIHVGLRYDFFYLGKQVFDPEYIKSWEALTLLPATWVDNESFSSQALNGNFSPRLSIGYPISVRTVFYFNYGHFLQYPERYQYFRPPVDATLADNSIGNPGLKPQRTVQYEAGFDQLIFDDLSLGIRGFYKDIFDLVATRHTRDNVWVNLDYASSRGFEVILTKQSSNHYSGSLGYTFQLAKGRSSDPFQAVLNPEFLGLPRETRVDWDQRHTLNLLMAYRVEPNEDYRVFGLLLNNWGASVTWNYGSGFPYTPYNQGRTLQDVYLLNTGDGPYTSEVNFSMYKGFKVLEQLNVVLTFDVINLFNRRNVDLTGGGFNQLTGAPTIYGDYDPSSKVVYSWTGREGEQSFDSRVTPFIFSSPRQISLGMKVTWN